MSKKTALENISRGSNFVEHQLWTRWAATALKRRGGGRSFIVSVNCRTTCRLHSASLVRKSAHIYITSPSLPFYLLFLCHPAYNIKLHLPNIMLFRNYFQFTLNVSFYMKAKKLNVLKKSYEKIRNLLN